MPRRSGAVGADRDGGEPGLHRADLPPFHQGAAGRVLHPVAGVERGEHIGPVRGRDRRSGGAGPTAGLAHAGNELQPGGRLADPGDGRNQRGVLRIGAQRGRGDLRGPAAVAGDDDPVPFARQHRCEHWLEVRWRTDARSLCHRRTGEARQLAAARREV